MGAKKIYLSYCINKIENELDNIDCRMNLFENILSQEIALLPDHSRSTISQAISKIKKSMYDISDELVNIDALSQKKIVRVIEMMEESIFDKCNLQIDLYKKERTLSRGVI